MGFGPELQVAGLLWTALWTVPATKTAALALMWVGMGPPLEATEMDDQDWKRTLGPRAYGAPPAPDEPVATPKPPLKKRRRKAGPQANNYLPEDHGQARKPDA